MMQASAKCSLISESMFQGKYSDEIVAAGSIKEAGFSKFVIGRKEISLSFTIQL